MGYVNELDRNLLEPLSGRVNCFHYWSQLLNDAPGLNSKPAINALLTACGLPASPAKSIEFEVPNIVNPHFKVAPHLDVQISFDNGPWTCHRWPRGESRIFRRWQTLRNLCQREKVSAKFCPMGASDRQTLVGRPEKPYSASK